MVDRFDDEVPLQRTLSIYALHIGDYRYRYVGLTSIDVQVRLRQHVRNADVGVRTPIYDWMRHHGAWKVRVETLEVCDSLDDLDLAEKKWIAIIRNRDNSLLNVLDGGYGNFGYRFTQEQRMALSVTMKTVNETLIRKPLSTESRRKMSESAKNREQNAYSSEAKQNMAIAQRKRYQSKPMSDETKEKIRQANLGKKMDEATKNKIRIANKGQKRTEAQRETMKRAQAARKAVND